VTLCDKSLIRAQKSSNPSSQLSASALGYHSVPNAAARFKIWEKIKKLSSHATRFDDGATAPLRHCTLHRTPLWRLIRGRRIRRRRRVAELRGGTPISTSSTTPPSSRAATSRGATPVGRSSGRCSGEWPTWPVRHLTAPHPPLPRRRMLRGARIAASLPALLPRWHVGCIYTYIYIRIYVHVCMYVFMYTSLTHGQPPHGSA
jgi:hypothetical protein